MRLFELNTIYLHGSHSELPIGTILKSRGDEYEADWGNTSFYHALEKYKPSKYLSHKDAVFMVDNDEDLDLAGASLDYVYQVQPMGPVYKHDINWGSEISGLIDDGYSIDSLEVKNAAINYWNGIPHFNESVWEYLTTSAKIIKDVTNEI